MVLKGKVVTEIEIRSSAVQFFNVFANQLHNLQNISGGVHHGKLHEGDWHDIGSVKSWTLTTEGKVETMKESIEAIDEENKLITFKFFDGEIGKNYKLFRLHVQGIDKEEGGSIAKWTIEYEKLNEDIPPPYRYLDVITTTTTDIDAHHVPKT
ncbi:MLP protein 31 [Spatholobus suberectus]|nr:MLP protein 31 [Spatholobus suberectus]